MNNKIVISLFIILFAVFVSLFQIYEPFDETDMYKTNEYFSLYFTFIILVLLVSLFLAYSPVHNTIYISNVYSDIFFDFLMQKPVKKIQSPVKI
jgi:hypothetical protein